MSIKPPPIEYIEGKAARVNGLGWELCPYPCGGGSGMSAARSHWLDGWIQTDIGIRLGGLFQRLGIEWP